MSVKNHLKELLSFSRRDRIGIVALLCLVLIIYLLPVLFKKEQPFPLKTLSLDALKDSLGGQEARRQKNPEPKEMGNELAYDRTVEKDFRKGELFPFDPNTVSIEGWQRLGLSERTSKTIEKYRSKGGKFYKPEDLQRIWGLPQGFYERVKDYISIPANSPRTYEMRTPSTYTRSEKKILVIDINSADTSALIALPGIGSKLAARIVGFREKLGGFYSVEQVKETYGLQDSTFQKIRSFLQLSGSPKQFNLNTVTKDELKTHPYFKWNLANAILEYRQQHGRFTDLQELKNIMLVDEEAFRKIVPYLNLQND